MTLTEEIRRCLRMPTFDNWQWEDEEILLLLQQMYVDLDLLSKFDIDFDVLRKFLCQVYMNYNEVPFHNFQHCFTVSQMVSQKGKKKSRPLLTDVPQSTEGKRLGALWLPLLIDRQRQRDKKKEDDGDPCQPQ
jgi:hypothetical protein